MNVPSWFWSPDFLAQSCHVGWSAFLVLLAARLWGLPAAWLVLAGIVLPKELIVDPLVEHDSLANGFVDIALCAAGGLLGTVAALVAARWGRR